MKHTVSVKRQQTEMIRSSKKDNSENRYRTEVEKQKYIKQKS